MPSGSTPGHDPQQNASSHTLAVVNGVDDMLAGRSRILHEFGDTVQLCAERARIKQKLYCEYGEQIERMLAEDKERIAAATNTDPAAPDVDVRGLLLDTDAHRQLKHERERALAQLREGIAASGKSLQEVEVHLNDLLGLQADAAALAVDSVAAARAKAAATVAEGGGGEAARAFEAAASSSSLTSVDELMTIF